jgi:glutamate racemase
MIKQKIGIFDSGVGGLTVFKEIRKSFPAEDIVYFGDTARVPYGSKSKNTIINYSVQNTNFLISKNVKVVIVACNSSTAIALEKLKKKFKIPIIGVIEPGAFSAVNKTKNKRIGVIGTDATINSHAYYKAIKQISGDINVIEKSCPLFVPLAEEGWQDTEIAKNIVGIYLKELIKYKIDTLVLGCTHYPILKKAISAVCSDKITLVDSAQELVNNLLSMKNIINLNTDTKKNTGKKYFFVSDN